ncbi:MAG: restriction endonuclease [Lewinellaceae bacterium]|nr:restriction endonuclease [Lewinellaceae bacterium]
MANKDVEYELFVKSVYQSILRIDGMEGLSVDHNVMIKGKSGCEHQIDVYFELRIAGEIQRFAIECKNYSKSIQIGKVRDFFGVVTDIGGIKGIMATKIGFQSGARLFGDFYRISLKEIRKPEEDDWNNRLRKIQFNVIMLHIKIKNIKINLDYDWIVKNFEYFDSEVLALLSSINEEIVLYFEDGEKDFDFRELEEKIPRKGKNVENLKYEFDFNKNFRFIDTNIGRVKVANIIVTYDEAPLSKEILIDSYHLTKAIFRDIQSGDMKFIKNL